ncbi:hypothetical protein PR202_gb29205 [Eleusine coracana subsp. coracana]|uniref:Uncharacterized protein n=1 Tax=Eleusine coracana subsp. coracana TaxID=191504 RepID=A0AAV5FZF2_ELECO|nr:hypothetical protein PR202_gb29205 [Eleusine coracana subsp. coracana]
MRSTQPTIPSSSPAPPSRHGGARNLLFIGAAASYSSSSRHGARSLLLGAAASSSSSSRHGTRSSAPSHGTRRRHLLKLAVASVSDPGGSLGRAKRLGDWRRPGQSEAAWAAAAALAERPAGLHEAQIGGETSRVQRFGLSHGGEKNLGHDSLVSHIWVTGREV